MARMSSLLTFLAASALSMPALAQDAEPAADGSAPQGPPAGMPEPPPDFFTTVRVLGGYQLPTDLDGSGEYDVSRLGFSAGVNQKVNDALRLDFSASYTVDTYGFDGGAAGSLAARDPWDEVRTLGLRGNAIYSINRQWAAFGGPLLSWSADSDADLADGLSGGGVIGVNYAESFDKRIGVGLLVTDQVRDDVRYLPIVIVDWRLTDTLTLRNSSYALSAGGPGFELAYDLNETTQLSFGAMWSSERFLLSEDSSVPGGVGSVSQLPVYATLEWNPDRSFELRASVGVVAWGQAEVQNSRGLRVVREDADPSVAFGLNLTVRF